MAGLKVVLIPGIESKTLWPDQVSLNCTPPMTEAVAGEACGGPVQPIRWAWIVTVVPPLLRTTVL